MKPRLRIVAPATENRTVTPRRRPNAELRTREYLTETEIEKLIKAASKNRWGHRDATMILVAYRHGLRASASWSICVGTRSTSIGPRWRFAGSSSGTPATHPIRGDELRALRRLQREQEPKSPFVFTSERGSPFTTSGFAKLVERAGEAARLGFPAHPHMLRTRLRVRPRQQRARYPGAAGVSRAQEYPAYGAGTRSYRRIGSRISGGADMKLPFCVACADQAMGLEADRARSPMIVFRRSRRKL